MQELIEGIKGKIVPDRWIVTPDAQPENIYEVLKEKGFKDLSEGAEQPEPGMYLKASDYVLCSPEENPEVVCREVQTWEDVAVWVDVVNTALHGWKMIDEETYYIWTRQENVWF